MINKLMVMYPEADPEKFGLQDNNDGNGAFIANWTQPFQQPTQEELDAITQDMVDTAILKEQFESIRKALQDSIDKQAKTLGFSNGNSLMLYAGFQNSFQLLAQTFATWEVSVWLEAEAYRQEVLLGTMPMLSKEEAVAMIPELLV